MRIGFTGHRPNRLHIGAERVAARLAEVCARFKAKAEAAAARAPVIAVSALAEGSDRLFANAALEAGFTLHALLPMPVADYVQTFTDTATTPAFHALLARAAHVETLPGTLADSLSAYEGVGRAMVEGCDVLVTVWDGKPAAGRGGTPEVIAHALEVGRPVVWINAAVDGEPRELRALSPGLKTAAWR